MYDIRAAHEQLTYLTGLDLFVGLRLQSRQTLSNRWQ